MSHAVGTTPGDLGPGRSAEKPHLTRRRREVFDLAVDLAGRRAAAPAAVEPAPSSPVVVTDSPPPGLRGWQVPAEGMLPGGVHEKGGDGDGQVAADDVG